MGETSALWFLRFVLIVTSVLVFALAADLGKDGVLFVFWRRTLLVFFVGGIALALLCTATFMSRVPLTGDTAKRVALQRVPKFLLHLGRLNLLGFSLCAAALFFIYLGPFGETFKSLPARFLVLWVASLGAAIFLCAWRDDVTPRWLERTLFSLILFSFLYQIAASLPALSLSPFSLGWSESTRYYHASLLLSQKFYDQSLTPFYQDLTRYILEAVPLLLPHPSLFSARLWETTLKFIMPALAVVLVLRRIAVPRALQLSLLLWGTLFLLQGPVYFYLLFCAIPILAFYDSQRRPALSIIALIIASIWAGLSRVNWIPVPPMLAIALYLLEKPIAQKNIFRYLAPPALYTFIGIGAAYLARQWYLDISQISPAMFNMAFHSDMLWYRLFPSALNAWGILPSALVLSAPLVILAVQHLRQRNAHWHPIRLLGLGSILLVMFIGGIIVSAKIGGGSNLHNLDGFLTLALPIGLYILTNRFVPDAEAGAPSQTWSPLKVTLTVLAVSVFTVSVGYPALPSSDRHEDDLAALQKLVNETLANGGEVLFISQRQLLTFDLIHGVPLIPIYDNIDLMEFAMTNYRPSIDQFHADMAAQRYALIIAPIPPGQLQDTDDAFGEENNAWAKRVSIPMLREYKILMTFESGDFVVLIPDS